LPGHLVLARIRCDQQEWEAAAGELQAALLLDSTHPVALAARNDVARQHAIAPPLEVAALDEAVESVEDDPGELVYVDEPDTEAEAAPVADPLVTESLAMLYHGQGHLAEAVDVLEALVARDPHNSQLVAKRDALRAELDIVRPRPYDASRSGGEPVRRWLSSLATARAPAAPPSSSFDAFFQTAPAPASVDGDLAAFQAWLRELER
jgi:hypothetical protein